MGYALGFGAASIAVLGFGTSFWPVKKYDTGDGIFFQWVMCASIWLCGLIVQFIRGSIFRSFASLGGVLWATGNMACVPVIHCIGVGTGQLVWGASNLLVGWLVGFFGLLGEHSADVHYVGMNVAGVVLALGSMCCLFFLETSTGKESSPALLGEVVADSNTTDEAYAALMEKAQGEDALSVGGGAGSSALSSTGSLAGSDLYDVRTPPYAVVSPDARSLNGESRSFADHLSQSQKRLLGFGGAILAGAFFGFNFNPPDYVKNSHGPDSSEPYSQANLDYVFSHFCGIFLASSVYFIIYCIVKKNKPQINPESVLPGFVCGCAWAIAQISWFIANEELQQVVSFPIVTTGPGIVAALGGVFLFGEIKGRRNYLILSSACAVTLVGVVLIALSRVL